MSTPLRRGASAGAVALILVLTPHWEGMDLVAKPDHMAHGLTTFCIGSTSYDDPKVKVGQRFTVEECKARFAKSIPKYMKPLEKCVHVDLTDHQWAVLFDASYNAGPTAACKSPMVRKFNAHDPVGACNAFAGWYEKAGGVWRKGLANRRRLDPKWSERVFCMTPDGEKPGAVPMPPAKPAIPPPPKQPEAAPAPAPEPSWWERFWTGFWRRGH